LKVWGITDNGKVRKENQDAYHAEVLTIGEITAPTECAICVICDGMGGAKSGNVASAIAVEYFVRVVKSGLKEAEKIPEPDMIKELLSGAITVANDAILARARSDPRCSDMGTTLVGVVAMADGRTVVVNVGDSRCYLVRRDRNGEDSSISQVTKDHSLVEDMIDRGELRREEARYHPNRNLITRALSADANTLPDFFDIDLNPGDLLLLCSDGLSNEADSREIAFELLYGDADTAVQRCLDIALGRGATDNVTVVLLES
jgi:protein phosphatase